MLRPLSIKHPAEDVFFWSDGHWGHDRHWIWQARGFKTVQEHDETLIARWNETVTDTAVVFHLGDLTFADSEGKRFEELVRRLRFARLYAMPGNHTSGFRQTYDRTLAAQGYPAGIEAYPLTWDLGHKTVTFLPAYVEIKVGKDALVLCHYPIESWNGMAKGALMCHGHSHNGLRRKANRRRDVGVDAYPRGPVSLRDLLRETQNEKADVVDHHGREEGS